jgi:hypothetical protein
VGTDREPANKQTTADQQVINIIEIFVVLFEEALDPALFKYL